MARIRLLPSFAICCALLAGVPARAAGPARFDQNPSGAAVRSDGPEPDDEASVQTAPQQASPPAPAGSEESVQTADEGLPLSGRSPVVILGLRTESTEWGGCNEPIPQDLLNPWGNEASFRPTAEIVESRACEGAATVSFDGRSSTDPDGVLVRWEWSFGDGSTGSGPVVTHAYRAAGSYQVELTVYDDQGNTNMYQETSYVSVATDLAVSQMVESYVSETGGDEIAVHVTVTNLGSLPVEAVKIYNSSPSWTSFISCTSPTGVECQGSGNSQRADVPKLAPGESLTVTFVAAVPRCFEPGGCPLENSVNVDSAADDANDANNTSVASVTMETVSEKDAPSPTP